jgi:hypothetical protein
VSLWDVFFVDTPPVLKEVIVTDKPLVLGSVTAFEWAGNHVLNPGAIQMVYGSEMTVETISGFEFTVACRSREPEPPHRRHALYRKRFINATDTLMFAATKPQLAYISCP